MARRQRKDDFDSCRICSGDEMLFRVAVRTMTETLPNYFTLCRYHMPDIARDSVENIIKIERIEI